MGIWNSLGSKGNQQLCKAHHQLFRALQLYCGSSFVSCGMLVIYRSLLIVFPYESAVTSTSTNTLVSSEGLTMTLDML